jgi:hypothetical protein
MDKKKLINSALGAAATALAAPGVLFASAGTAQAAPTEVDFGPVAPGSDLTANVVNNTATNFGSCQYVSTPQWPSLLAPYTSNWFEVPAYTSTPVQIGNYFGPGAVRTGTTWTISVNCGNGFFPVNVNGGNGNTYTF